MEIRDAQPQGRTGAGRERYTTKCDRDSSSTRPSYKRPNRRNRRVEINSRSTITDPQAYISILSRAEVSHATYQAILRVAIAVTPSFLKYNVASLPPIRAPCCASRALLALSERMLRLLVHFSPQRSGEVASRAYALFPRKIDTSAKSIGKRRGFKLLNGIQKIELSVGWQGSLALQLPLCRRRTRSRACTSLDPHRPRESQKSRQSALDSTMKFRGVARMPTLPLNPT
jgi:hypothetical protein